MLFRRFGKHVREHDWFAVAMDILVLIVGLMLAFQVDRWWELRAERVEELGYIDRLIDDVETDIPAIEHAIALQSMRLEFAELLMAVVDDPAPALAQPVVFLSAVDQASFTFTPSLIRHTFDDLRATGNMDLIRSVEITQLLHDYHTFDQTQWQYRPLQFQTEFKHFELSAGILDYQQVRSLQNEYLFLSPGDIERARAARMDEAGVKSAVERFQDRPDLHDWLPHIRSMQMESIWVHNMRLKRAQALLEALQAYRQHLAPTGSQ